MLGKWSDVKLILLNSSNLNDAVAAEWTNCRWQSSRKTFVGCKIQRSPFNNLLIVTINSDTKVTRGTMMKPIEPFLSGNKNIIFLISRKLQTQYVRSLVEKECRLCGKARMNHEAIGKKETALIMSDAYEIFNFDSFDSGH